MSLQFILGRAGSGKTSYCVEQIKRKLLEQPQGQPIILIVPDQMSFQMEVLLATDPELKGMIRAQVYSLSRLAYRVFQETGGSTRVHLDQVGITMILRKIIEKRKDDFIIYKRSAQQPGFYVQLEQMIAEFKRYCVSPQELLQQTAEESSPAMLKDKVHDLQLIYQDFEQALLHKYLDSEDFLSLFVEKIPESHYLREAELFIDGFYQFTPQELLVLDALLKYTRKISLTLTLDQPYDEQLPSEMDLFYTTAKTYQQLKLLAQKAGLSLEPPIVQTVGLRFKDSPSLQHLEAQFDRRPVQMFEGKLDLELGAAVNRRAEVESTARQIIRLVRDQNYRWKDIAILTRNMSVYQDFIETVFEDYDIPIFIDQKRSMLHHPLIELLRSVLEVITQNWRYEAIFRCVKTDLLFPWSAPEEIRLWRERYDQLENFVLAHGINGKQWTQKQRWSVYRSNSLDEELRETDRDAEAEEELEALRQMIIQPILQLQKGLEQAENVRERCEQLYLFMEELQVYEKLELWGAEAEQQGSLREAREHAQTWKGFIHVLEQMVEMMGEETISLELFSKILETGCEHLKYSIIPPALDQVVLGSIELSRFTNVKHAFILGLNDGLIPARLTEDGLITEDEREELQASGVRLAPGHRIQLAEEYFYLYIALSSASDGVHLSYALADEEGKALSPSNVLLRMKQMFPLLQERLFPLEPHEVSPQEQIDFVARPHQTLSYLTTQLRQWKKGYPIAPVWWDIYNWFVQQPSWKKLAEDRLDSLFYKNIALPLTEGVSRSLYGEQIMSSVSRMELFQACPFSHFLSYGLNLRERRIYRLESPDIGQLFHSALKQVDDELRRRKQSWSDLTLEECQRLAKQAVDEIAKRMRGNILSSNHRHHYIKYKLQQVVERASSVLHQHAKATQFEPLGMEIGFGPGGVLPALQIPLANGIHMDVVGRIDRVDQARGSNGLLLRVIDFKSSRKDLQLAEVYHGLSLQMLTYLDVLITHSKHWLGEQALPAGVLYFHLHNPMLRKKSLLPQEKLEQELYRQFKMRGLILADQETVQLMDMNLESQHSEVIPVALKKDGSFYSQSKVASPEEFTHLRRYVRKQMRDIGTKLTKGRIDITPYKMKQKIACTFCPYKPVCHYDQTLEENSFVHLPVQKNEEVLQEIRAQFDRFDEGNV